MKKCCKDYNGMLDVTNSCIFCKTYLGKISPSIPKKRKTRVINESKINSTPNPGTQEAIDAGCKCPVMDNHYGLGWDGQGKDFIYNMNCELHGSDMWVDKDGLHIK